MFTLKIGFKRKEPTKEKKKLFLNSFKNKIYSFRKSEAILRRVTSELFGTLGSNQIATVRDDFKRTLTDSCEWICL